MKRVRHRSKGAGSRHAGNLVIERAYATLKAHSIPIGSATKPVRVVVDLAILETARGRTGITDNAALVNAALAVLAAGDDFGPYLIAQSGRLSADFELAL